MNPFAAVASVSPASTAREGAGKAAPDAPQGRFEEALAEATPPAGRQSSRAAEQRDSSHAVERTESSRAAEETDEEGATEEASTERPARPKHRARPDADVSVLLDLYRVLVPPAPKPVAARPAGPAASALQAMGGPDPRAPVRTGEAEVKPQQETGAVNRRTEGSLFAIRTAESRPRSAASEEAAPSTGTRTPGLELTTLRGEPAQVAAVTAPPAALAMLELHQGETAVRGAIDAQHAQLSMRVGGEELSVLLRLHGSIADVRVTGALPSQLAPGVAEDALRAALAGTGLTAGVLEVRPPSPSASSHGAGSSDHGSFEDGTDPEHRSPERQPDGDA